MPQPFAEVLEKKYALERAIFQAIAKFEHDTGAGVASVELRRSREQPESGAPRLESVGLWVAT